jgi:hypothetical protein
MIGMSLPYKWLLGNKNDMSTPAELLQELCRLYHTTELKVKGKNHWTFPPVKDGKVIKN